jgi:lipopolysaccharide transport system ATP-binding protein
LFDHKQGTHRKKRDRARFMCVRFMIRRRTGNQECFVSDLALSVTGLSKSFRLGHRLPYHRFSEFIENVARNVARLPSRILGKSSGKSGEAPGSEIFWALEDVSFDVPRGEVLGIIGRNGAGKSTLLKLLSRITRPTRGRMTIQGRVGSLLEVGTGFHPELTGRENIFLNGAVLGMSQGDIRRKFDEIVDFAEVERFLDTPVKHYSSGMYIRLGFSVAAALKPDLLIIDEVLAVGDVAFQKKCFGKMQDVVREGRTILLVSHNLSAVTALCSRAILLEHGRLVQDGPAADVIERYLQSSGAATGETRWTDVASAPQTDHVRLLRVCIRQQISPDPTGFVDVNLPVLVDIDYECRRQGGRIWTGIWLRDRLGTMIFAAESNSSSDEDPRAIHRQPQDLGTYRTTCTIPAHLLNQAAYTIAVIAGCDGPVAELIVEDAVDFTSNDPQMLEKGYHSLWSGLVRPWLPWNTIRLT